MRKDTKMDAHVTRSGYRYYTPTQKNQKSLSLKKRRSGKRPQLARKSHLVRNKESTECNCESCRFDGCDSTHVSPLYL